MDRTLFNRIFDQFSPTPTHPPREAECLELEVRSDPTATGRAFVFCLGARSIPRGENAERTPGARK